MTQHDEETSEPTIEVYVVERERIETMPVRQAAAGIIAYARQSLGAGTPACGVWEKRAIELLAEHGYQPNGKKIT